MKAKKNTNGIKKTPFILGVAFIALGCTLGISSFAWFYLPQSTRQVEGMDGEATGSYFSIVNQETKIADGTSKNPYGIKTAKQLYYFNWLQDLGYFNKDENGDGFIDQQYYFVLMNDIDAGKYVLPPAGTKEYPFVGNFEGNGHTISNLKISNSWGNLTDKPKGAKQDANNDTLLSSAEIVGFFGIVGQYSSGASTTAGSVTTGSVNCKAKDGSAKTATYTIRSVSGTGDSAATTYVNAVNNLYFDKLEVSTVADKTLAGLLAGYVNGQMQYCGVRSGNFSFGSNVKVLTDDVLKEGDNANTKLSKYSLIGDYNSNNFDWAGKPTNGSTGNDWGGSIDIASLVKRVNYMAKHGLSSWKTGLTYKTIDTDFNADLYYSKTWNWDDAAYSGQYVGLNDETYFPLNIDLSKATISGSDITDSNRGSYYTNGSNTSEPVSSTNTGYIVGRKEGSNATPRLHNKAMSSSASTSKDDTTKNNGIRYSINATDQGTAFDATAGENGAYSVFDYKNISFFYIDSETQTTYRISDDENSGSNWSTTYSTKNVSECGFDALDSGYYNVKHNFSKMLNDANTDDLLSGKKNGATSSSSSSQSNMPFINLNGIQLYRISSSETNEYEKGTYSNITIDGNTYSSYQMYKGGINFHLKEDGRLKMILGAYTSSTDTTIYNLPYIYKVDRSPDNTTIETSKKITAVYKTTDGNGNVSYSLKYDGDSSVPSGDLVLNLENLYSTTKASIKAGCAYYIEVPLKKGDYFFGASKGSTNCPFVMYLDIAANSGNSSSGSTESIPPIDFVYYSDTSKKIIKKINSKKTVDGEEVSDYTPSSVTFAISGSPSQIYFWRVETTVDGVQSITLYYTVSGTVEVVGNGKDKTDDSKSSEDYTSN